MEAKDATELVYSVEAATQEDVAWIEARMKEFDRQFLPEENIRNINYLVRNDQGEPIGGIVAQTRYRTVCINTIWIRSDYRKRGIGRHLIELVEKRAKELGCIVSSLGTFEKFNTKEMYEHLGYKVVSTSIDSPEGHTGYWFNKPIA
jgi:GNAT superfamily N-acetyltransferase